MGVLVFDRKQCSCVRSTGLHAWHKRTQGELRPHLQIAFRITFERGVTWAGSQRTTLARATMEATQEVAVAKFLENFV